MCELKWQRRRDKICYGRKSSRGFELQVDFSERGIYIITKFEAKFRWWDTDKRQLIIIVEDYKNVQSSDWYRSTYYDA